ncbi:MULTISPECIES: glycosyltransferase [Rhizobium/Agrobacterium group]|jgi:glycosyltransferase involved in cell wall biosynthesis|uniref:glycosyltransferase n=1 Tax=Rhizobium/Agrobacterium group TaxID=227290 RepID=UPI0010D59ADD|nr:MULTISPECIES: glycosyltransferase [Rhizobium/Agrobacterium group]TCR85773.1 glycosyltransferase involved in cell wall biosynthesis [Rhizobium sp. BK376]
MRILLASGTPHLPQLIGGLEINTHHLALELNERGCSTGVLSKLSLRDSFGAMRFAASCAQFKNVVVDRSLGYEVYRCLRPWKDLRGLVLPQVVVIQNGNMVQMGRAFREKGIASIAYLHGLEFDGESGNWPDKAEDLPFSAYIGNSLFTAARFKARYGIDTAVIPPIFRPDVYRTYGEGRHVTFINPIQAKGLDIALAVATLCPDIPFLFVRAWPLSKKEEAELQRRLAMLANVRLVDRTTDMASIYKQTRILFVPTQWQETWGRVVSEAHFSGIPVLSSDLGGLSESVGPGGILVNADASPIIWAEHLRLLWNDPTVYQEKREAAFAYADRPEIMVDRQMEQFVDITERVAA